MVGRDIIDQRRIYNCCDGEEQKEKLKEALKGFPRKDVSLDHIFLELGAEAGKVEMLKLVLERSGFTWTMTVRKTKRGRASN
jgi:hypothetical protein